MNRSMCGVPSSNSGGLAIGPPGGHLFPHQDSPTIRGNFPSLCGGSGLLRSTGLVIAIVWLMAGLRADDPPVDPKPAPQESEKSPAQKAPSTEEQSQQPAAPVRSTPEDRQPVKQDPPPSAPKSLLARREDLPRAFRKPVPTAFSDLTAMEGHVSKLAARVSPAVVAVSVGDATGSGVVISNDGLVLTAAHVCGEPGRAVVFTFPDGKTARGKTLGTNHDTDSGLMRITEEGSWPHVEIGELRTAQLGDWVLALGHPGGFDRERSMVVRLGRIIMLTPVALQTDCTLIGGDSGGPLFDMHGRVIAIHSRISESTAANFHVPIGTYQESWDRLAKSQNWGVEVPVVGLTVGDHPEGCQLERVQSGRPGSRAGLKVGDVVLKINDRTVTNTASFQRYVFSGGASRFSVGGIKDLSSFAAKLKEQTDPVSAFLWGRFSDAVRRQVSSQSETPSENDRLQQTLVRELNRILQEGSIYQSERFADVSLSRETQLLLNSDSSDEVALRLNRLLLEDAYPRELVKSRDSSTLQIKREDKELSLTLNLPTDQPSRFGRGRGRRGGP